MTANIFSSLRPILAAPWQQRRNTASLWGMGFFVFMILLGPGATLAVNLIAHYNLHREGATALQIADATELAATTALMTANAGAVALVTLVFAWWTVAVANLLDQNRAVLARLVPGHVLRLRVALVVAWALASVLIVLPMAGAFGHAMICAAAAGPALAIVAVALRWPGVWVLGAFAPLPWVFEWPPVLALDAFVREQWVAQPLAITLTVAAMSVVLLVALVQAGGRHHIASDLVQRDRRKRFKMRDLGQQPYAAAKGSVIGQPYFAWWRWSLARPGGSTFGRLMLGLGPALHWTSLVGGLVGSALGVAGIFAIFELVAAFHPTARAMAPDLIGYASTGLVLGLLAPPLQVQSRLQQTRREQALLALLPGVPQGAALSRRLAWQFNAQLTMAVVGAVLVLVSMRTVLHVLHPSVPTPWVDDLARWLPIGALPLAVFLWRPWSRLGASSSLAALVPVTLAGFVVAAIAMGRAYDVYDASTVAAVVMLPAAAWCAFRWWRMGREPRSLPAGRLA